MKSLHSQLEEANNELRALRYKLRNEINPGPKRTRLINEVTDAVERVIEIEDEIRKKLKG